MLKTKKKKFACEECKKKKKKCSGNIPCGRCTQLGLRNECIPMMMKRRGPRRRIPEEEVRIEVRGETVELVLPTKQQAFLTLMLSYGEDALRKKPHETAEAFGVGSLLCGFAAYAAKDGGEIVKLAEQGDDWNIDEVELRHEVVRATEGSEGACIRRSSVEWGELNVFINGAGRTCWILVRRYGDDEFVPRKKSSMASESENEDELFDLPRELDTITFGDEIMPPLEH